MKKSRIRVIKKTRRNFVVRGVLGIFLIILGGYFTSEYQVFQKVLFVKSKIEGAENQAFSERGVIYDRYYTPLAESKTKVSVYCRSREVDDPEKFIATIKKIIPLDSRRLRAHFESGELRIWIADGITEEQEKSLNKADIEGLFFTRQVERFYPQAELTAHLVGVVDEDIGVSGIEYYFDELLTGAVECEHTKIAGIQDLVLSLDLKIQKSLYNLLLRIADGNNVERITGYVVDTKTGALVAGAQWPSYDPNDYSDYSQKVFENFFLQNVPIAQGLQRLFVTTAALLDKADNKPVLPWSVRSLKGNIGSELRLWDQLGLDDFTTPDFAEARQHKRGGSSYVSLASAKEDTSLPALLTPLQMLMGLASLAHGEGKVHSHVVEKVLNRKTHQEVFLQDESCTFSDKPQSVYGRDEVQQFIQSSASVYGRENYMLRFFQKVTNQKQEIFGQEFFFSFAPTPQADLAMLLVVEHNSNVVALEDTETIKPIQSMLSRVAALQQIAAVMGENVGVPKVAENEYLTVTRIKDKPKSTRKKVFSTEPMPDLIGLSLRRSLALLDRYKCKIQVEGTGWVSSQYPPKGSSMKDVHTCRISLQNPEKLRSPDKL